MMLIGLRRLTHVFLPSPRKNLYFPNTAESFVCDCESTGYEGASCEKDVNECEMRDEASQICGQKGKCINYDGGFGCRCPTGYTGIGCMEVTGFCTDRIKKKSHTFGFVLDTYENRQVSTDEIDESLITQERRSWGGIQTLNRRDTRTKPTDRQPLGNWR